MSEPTLVDEIKRLNQILNRLYARQSFGRFFLSGIFTGLGSVVGATLFISLIVYFLSKVELIPIIGSWFGQLIPQIIQNLPAK